VNVVAYVCVRACASVQHGKNAWLSTKDTGTKAWWEHGKTPGHNAIQSPQVRAHIPWRRRASRSVASGRPRRASPPPRRGPLRPVADTWVRRIPLTRAAVSARRAVWT